MRWRRRTAYAGPGPMPDRFHVLAEYNAERARGIVHTRTWIVKMGVLQREYDIWVRTSIGPVQIVGEEEK